MLGSFILLYGVLTVFGSYLITQDVRSTGCDPSEAVADNEACPNPGADIFGSMLGIAFAAQGLSMAANFIEVS